MPLLTHELDLDARTFPLGDGAAKGLDERFDLGERDGDRRWPSRDGSKRLAVFGVHRAMIAKCAINCNELAPGDGQRLS